MVTKQYLSRVYHSIKALVRDDSGPTSVEYAVMLALIIGVCAATVNTLANSLRDNFDNSADQISNAL